MATTGQSKPITRVATMISSALIVPIQTNVTVTMECLECMANESIRDKASEIQGPRPRHRLTTLSANLRVTHGFD